MMLAMRASAYNESSRAKRSKGISRAKLYERDWKAGGCVICERIAERERERERV